MDTNKTHLAGDAGAALNTCPECGGHGELAGGTCGVCLGDQVLVAPASSRYSFMVHDRLTNEGTRFVDHSGIDHDCDRCDRCSTDAEAVSA